MIMIVKYVPYFGHLSNHKIAAAGGIRRVWLKKNSLKTTLISQLPYVHGGTLADLAGILALFRPRPAESILSARKLL